MSPKVESPQGYQSFVTNVGIKDQTKDFVCILSTVSCQVVAMFTQSRFAGPSVVLSREHVKDGQAQAIVVISKNANVATGISGMADAQEIVLAAAQSLSIPPEHVLIASTGVIGRRYPMEKIRPVVTSLKEKMRPADFEEAAQGIMTTDRVPKFMNVRVGNAVLTGIAKGVGMMEPNMATLLTFFFTDAAIEGAAFKSIFRRVVDKTFNAMSIDTDTSTSDTALMLSNGLAGEVDKGEFEEAFEKVATHLVKALVKDGEGTTKLLEVTVETAKDHAQAKRVAKAIINSPLVKTAMHGADPNWGRVAMAIGKCSNEIDIVPEKTNIRFGEMEVFPRQVGEEMLSQLSDMMISDEIKIHVDLNIGNGHAMVWGCDLSADYIKLNSEYTT